MYLSGSGNRSLDLAVCGLERPSVKETKESDGSHTSVICVCVCSLISHVGSRPQMRSWGPSARQLSCLLSDAVNKSSSQRSVAFRNARAS